MKLSTGISKKENAHEAGKEAAEKAYEGNEKIAYVFATSKCELEKALEGVSEVFKEIPIAGCSSMIEIVNGKTERRSVVVGGFSGDIDAGVGIGHGLEENSKKAGKTAIKKAADQLSSEEIVPYRKIKANGWETQKDTIINIFADTLHGNGARMLEGINEFLGPGYGIAGQFAADELEFQHTYVFYNGKVFEDAVVCTVIKTDQKIGTGSAHGFQPTQHQYKVTKSEQNYVSEINGKPPAEVYKEIYGEKIEEPGFLLMTPFGMKDENENRYRLRVGLDIDEKGGFSCGAPVPNNQEITLMIGQKNKLMDAAEEAAEKAMQNAGLEKGQADVVLVNSCVARDAIYQDEKLTQEEIDRVLGKTGDANIFGIYGFGQIGPSRGWASFNEETMIIQVIGQEP